MTKHTHANTTYPTMHTLQQIPTSNILGSHTDTNSEIILHLAKPKPNETVENRTSIDIFCDACGQHGHPWKRYDYLAKLLKALAFTTKLDKPKQLELRAAYHKEQQKQRESKLKRNLGRAHTLKDNGDIEGLYNLLLEDTAEWNQDITLEE
jgi:hypothetical protein